MLIYILFYDTPSHEVPIGYIHKNVFITSLSSSSSDYGYFKIRVEKHIYVSIYIQVSDTPTRNMGGIGLCLNYLP